MNQILLTNNQSNKKKSNNRYSNNNSGDMKKIIIFFSIAILIFALLIIGVYTYKIIKNQNQEEKIIGKPEVSLEEIDSQVKIVTKAEAGINKIVYKWNNEEDKEVVLNGTKNYEEALEIPEGENTLRVKITDQNGDEIETSKDFYREENKEKPRIEIDETIGNGKVKITATDENNTIKYITYKWNDEEEVTVEATEENQTIIETIIDVKRGKNTLKVTAVNGSAKEQTEEKIFNGVNNPVIEVYKDGNKLYMKITHDMGFEKIEFNVNGQDYIYDENFSGYDSEKKEISYKFNLLQGENKIIIHAISTEGTEATYKGKCNYTAE